MMLCLMLAPADKAAGQSAAPTGMFDAATDVGNGLHPGSSRYDPLTAQYQLRGAGTNMWFDNDEFHFLWKRIRSDFELYTWLSLVGEGVEPHRKAGLMIRESLQPNAPYVSAAYHGDGLVALQYRPAADSLTREIRAEANFLSILKLERQGNNVRMYAAAKGEPLQRVGEIEIEFNRPDLHAGLFVCSHNPDVVEAAVFSNTRLSIPAKPDFIPYRDYIGSRLEILTVETGRREVVYESAQPFEAPNWSRDGKYLVVNRRGKLYRIPAAGGEPELIETDFADANNNDHGFSPDGKMLAISHHAKDLPDGENSLIYILPATGGTPRQVTGKGPSYWHGWSPDGKHLIYTANRNGQWDIYRIAVGGGAETQLTDTPFLDDGSEYSTDGKYIWFNANRSGSMDIWRMNADGSGQTQITRDQYQNWFPHQSPDGRYLVFLSYPPEVKSGDHPYYKQVMLRMLNLASGEIQVLTHLYGGQGTINVPSWSPDSQKIAFVSNTGTAE